MPPMKPLLVLHALTNDGWAASPSNTIRPDESTQSWIPSFRDINRVRMTYGAMLISRCTLHGARGQQRHCRERETDLLRAVVFEIDLLRREQLIPALFPALLEPVEIMPRIEVEEEFFLGALDTVSQSPGDARD